MQDTLQKEMWTLRSIVDVQPEDLKGYKQCHFFAGIGVWSYALRQAGWVDDREVWTGSCPCQPFSSAGKKGTFDDERHLWPEMFRLITACKPSVVFGEQVASKDGLSWLDSVQADLEGADYSSAAADLCAAGVGAPHIRQRLYWVADASVDSTTQTGSTVDAYSQRQIQLDRKVLKLADGADNPQIQGDGKAASHPKRRLCWRCEPDINSH
jgi:DNA (cytosine-5)-methyltransferase 1